MHTVYLLLGSNKGNRLRSLLLARFFLEQKAGKVTKTSQVFVTDPWGKTDQARYLNQGLALLTERSPFQLLKITKKIEKQMGRTSKHNNAARIIDIDILFMDDVVLDSKNLVIPHPRLHLRNFTLDPMLELDKSYTHPVLGKSIEQLAKDCADTGKVSIFKR